MAKLARVPIQCTLLEFKKLNATIEELALVAKATRGSQLESVASIITRVSQERDDLPPQRTTTKQPLRNLRRANTAALPRGQHADRSQTRCNEYPITASDRHG